MKAKGFTLVELLVVIAIIAMLMSILMPALSRVRQIAYRMVCGTNLSGIGKAMIVYTNDYDGQLPKAGLKDSVWGGNVLWSELLRESAFKNKSATVSSSLYLLVKYAEVTPKAFLCKGASGVTEFKLSEYKMADKDYVQVWDFGPEPWKHCSYTYHMPYNHTFVLTASSDPGMPVASDFNPWISSPAADKKDFSKYSVTGSPEIQKLGNSASHQEDGQNVLYMDTHVNFENRPTCGIEEDNIYTFRVGTDIKRGGVPFLTERAHSKPADRNDAHLVHDAPLR